MNGESDIYDAIAAGGNHIGEFYEELTKLGRKPAEIKRGVDAARARLNQKPKSSAPLGGNGYRTSTAIVGS